jgi:fructose-specific phosphotransferase system IIA component
MRLTDLLSKEVIKLPLEKATKESVIGELVDLLATNKKVMDRDSVFQSVLEREQVMSTGVGDSVAIPHCKSEAVKGVVVAFGISQNGIDFQSIDSKPVRLVFLLVATPDATGPHLKILSRVSRLLNKKVFRDNLMLAQSPEDVMSLIQQEEMAVFEN